MKSKLKAARNISTFFSPVWLSLLLGYSWSEAVGAQLTFMFLLFAPLILFMKESH